KETTNKKVEPKCCFETTGAKGNNDETILVRGFDCSFPRDDIKSSLEKHFGSCGKITRVFVPVECHTNSPLGFVTFVTKLKSGQEGQEKALLLDGSYLGGLKLEVVLASHREEEYYCYPNFKGCKRCCMARYQLPMKDFLKDFCATSGGRLYRIPARYTNLFLTIEF
ncbi:hypothetical protein CARUB_v10003477mg, partial [Capsella rubella]